jgi:hypothetical protein
MPWPAGGKADALRTLTLSAREGMGNEFRSGHWRLSPREDHSSPRDCPEPDKPVPRPAMIWWIACISFFLFLILHFRGGVVFWSVVSRNADKAYALFLDDSAWHVLDGVTDADPPPERRKYNGPFLLFVPRLDRQISLYALKAEMKQSQVRILREIRSNRDQAE